MRQLSCVINSGFILLDKAILVVYYNLNTIYREAVSLSERVYNFNPGPSTLPVAALEQAQRELVCYPQAKMSILEMSHRSAVYEEVQQQATIALTEMLGLDDNYQVLFLQGGASLQFAMIPMNLLAAGQTADYLVTGMFAKRAWEEAAKLGTVQSAANMEAENFCRIPSPAELRFSDNPAYIHMTTNNTIYGTQWHYLPECGSTPLIADMSSDILSYPVDGKKFALIYAGAQKNLGVAGLTIVIMRRDLLERCSRDLPIMLRYDMYAANNSLYNTPPVFAVYMANLNLQWLKAQGGPLAMQHRNQAKAELIYQAIDRSNGFYRGHAAKDSRSLMNITFRLAKPQLEASFVAEAATAGLLGLNGHRSVGGIRASIYNAMSTDGCQALADFMQQFQARYS